MHNRNETHNDTGVANPLNSTGLFLEKEFPRYSLSVWYGTSVLLSLTGAVLCTLLVQAIKHHWTTTATKHHNNQRGIKLLILHMAAVEIFMCGVFFPVNYTQIFFGQYMNSVLLCTATQIPFGVMRTLTNYIDAILSANRMTAMCIPTLYRRYLTGLRVNIISLAIIWCISVAVFIQPMIGWTSRFEPTPPLNVCAIKLLGKANASVQLSSWVNTYIPMGLTALFYFIMLLSLVFRRFFTELASSSHHRNRALKLSLTLCLSAVLRSAFNVPHAVIYAYNNQLLVRHAMLVPWLRTGFAVGYAANPVIFFGIHREYRTALVSSWIMWMDKVTFRPHRKGKVNPAVEVARLGISTISKPSTGPGGTSRNRVSSNVTPFI